MTQQIEQLRFLSENQVRSLASQYGTPIYVYSRSSLKSAVEEVLSAFSDMPFGLTVRYAMKANPHPEVIKLFDEQGLEVDASSEFEAYGAISAGVDPKKILLTSQQPPLDMQKVLRGGIKFTATSLHQLKLYGKSASGTAVSVRLNTGLGSGANHRLTTGGIEVGFGIWFGDNQVNQIDQITKQYDLVIERVHIHIGTGSDPAIWGQLIDAGLEALKSFPGSKTLNLGGGFKLGYMSGETGADLGAIGQIARQRLTDFEKQTGRQIKLEIEPGRYLTARAGSIISTIVDETDTGESGDNFLKLDSGMTEIIRPAMYGARHPLIVVPKNSDSDNSTQKYVVIGHCCESGDLLTPAKDNPEQIEPRLLTKAKIGDFMVIEMAGSYCASMSAKGYNSFPTAKEVIVN